MGFMDRVKAYRDRRREEDDYELRARGGKPHRVLDGSKIREKADRGFKNLKENVKKQQYADNVERVGVAIGGSAVRSNRGDPKGLRERFGFGRL